MAFVVIINVTVRWNTCVAFHINIVCSYFVPFQRNSDTSV